MRKCYHIGTVKHGATLVVQARRNIDFLDCELWRYWGAFTITKRELREKRQQLLKAINAEEGTQFTKIRID